MWDGNGLLSRLYLGYIRWVPHPGKLRLVRALYRLFFENRLVVQSDNGANIRIEIDDYIGWAIAATGSYEPATLKSARRLLNERPGIFVDVGANAGLFSCYLGLEPGVSCIAIEPHPVQLDRLQKNLELNSSIRCELVAAAVGASFEILPMKDPHKGNQGTAAIAESEVADLWVAGTTLTDVLSKLGCEAVELMKIDIEGYELQAIQGLDLQGSARPRHIILEVNELAEPAGRAATIDYLVRRGYGVSQIDGSDYVPGEVILESNLIFSDSLSTAQ
ncbi:MAG: FkbM family methyltransferase [Pseudomonadales bacterium]|nr:FkbM family methyltransferase [Pseudomonadales bacterium]